MAVLFEMADAILAGTGADLVRPVERFAAEHFGEVRLSTRVLEMATKGRRIRVASGRRSACDRPDGMAKLVIEPGTERILGVGICGHGAGELIGEGVLAVEMGATVEDLAESMHPHPTLSETLMECAEAFHGHSASVVTRRKRDRGPDGVPDP